MAELQKQYSIGGICAVCPEIIIRGKSFCFTGVSKKATRNEIAGIIENAGGIYNDRITADTDYLIVNAEGGSFGFDASDFSAEIDGYLANFTVDGGQVFVSFTAVPEPATIAGIFGVLALAFAAYRRRK